MMPAWLQRLLATGTGRFATAVVLLVIATALVALVWTPFDPLSADVRNRWAPPGWPHLLGTDGTLYAAGRATRAAERGRPGYQSASREERREIAAAALRGGYPVGTPVNYDAVPIPIATVVHDDSAATDGPVGMSGGALRVRWRPGASLDGAPTLQTFLAERVDLLVNPPLGAD